VTGVSFSVRFLLPKTRHFLSARVCARDNARSLARKFFRPRAQGIGSGGTIAVFPSRIDHRRG